MKQAKTIGSNSYRRAISKKRLAKDARILDRQYKAERAKLGKRFKFAAKAVLTHRGFAFETAIPAAYLAGTFRASPLYSALVRP